VEEERVTRGLFGERAGLRGPIRGRREQDHGEGAGIVVAERREQDVSHVARQLRKELGVVGSRALRDEEQDRRRIGRTQQRIEERQAVGIGPLQVVDAEHDRVARTHPREQRAERRETSVPQFLRIEHGRTGGRGHGRDAPEPREDARESIGVARQELGQLRRLEAREVPRERVDDAVESLVRKRFAFVATACEDDEVRFGSAELFDEGRAERALAEARLALDADGDGAGFGTRVVERALQKP
jgi:hypothetical protein